MNKTLSRRPSPIAKYDSELLARRELSACAKKCAILEKKLTKLKRLVLLTDDAVSNQAAGGLTVLQWNEFVREFPDEA